MSETTKQTLLKQAAKMIGDEELAVHLKVPVHVLEAWMKGQATMPDRKLVVLADVLDRLSSNK